MRRRIAMTAIAALALASVPAVAVAGKGGGGSSVTSFAISSQARGSLTFSISMSSAPRKELGVSSLCFDNMSQQIWSGYLDVDWATPTVGYAGAFSPPSGARCYAYAHNEGTETPLDGATYSYIAP